MKRIAMLLFGAVALAGAAAYTFREPLQNAVADRITAGMFVANDDDAYDPGVAAGQALPPIRARYNGREITDVSEFMGSKGMVLFVNRSVDW